VHEFPRNAVTPEATMSTHIHVHSSLISLTLALSLAACSSPSLQVPLAGDPVVAPGSDSVIAAVPNDPDLSSTAEPTMAIPKDAETAALNSGFGGLNTFGRAIPYANIANEAQADAAGNVYVAGVTGAAFAGQNFNGGSDGFLVKFNTNGQLQWVRLLGTSGDETAIKVVPSPNGSVYVAGTTSGALFSAALDPSGLQTRADLFLAKFDTNGTRLWGKQFGSNGLDSVSDMRVDPNGNAIVSGVVKNTMVGARGASGKGAFVVFAGPQGVLTSPRFYNVGNETPTFVKMDRSLNTYVNSTTRPDPLIELNTMYTEKMTKFLADGTRQLQLSSPLIYWKVGYSYRSDSNGVTFLNIGGFGGFQDFVRYDAGVQSWAAGRQIAPFGGFTEIGSAQAISNTDAYALYGSQLLRLGAAGAVLKRVTLPSDPSTYKYTYPQGFNLDRQGNIFIVGSQSSRDANDNFLQQPFVVKYNPSFVLQ
jgi:hypothetical protein